MQQTWIYIVGFIALGRMNQHKILGPPHVWFCLHQPTGDRYKTNNALPGGQLFPTPPNSEIICGQNVGTKVVCGMILFFEKKAMLKV